MGLLRRRKRVPDALADDVGRADLAIVARHVPVTQNVVRADPIYSIIVSFLILQRDQLPCAANEYDHRRPIGQADLEDGYCNRGHPQCQSTE